MKENSKKEKIIIIDFGSQVTKLIARRVRELGVFSEVLTLKDLKRIKDFNKIKGIILSGGPATVTVKNFPNIPSRIFLLNIPILGICYGLQLIAINFGGKVKSGRKRREFGRAILLKKNSSLLTKNFYKTNKSYVWMSHQDIVYKLPKDFKKRVTLHNY